MTNCNGCRNYQPTYETCSALRGQVTCLECDHVYTEDELGRMKCPTCKAWKGADDLSECPDGEPSVACPGREEPEPVMRQKGLFDE